MGENHGSSTEMSLECPAQAEMGNGSIGSEAVRLTIGASDSGGSHEGQKYAPSAREEYVRRLPVNPAGRILDIGCSNGSTGALALREGKCGYYCGVEVCQESARLARSRISDVIVADVETFVPRWPERSFDVLILSEVLEHMRDPGFVLRKLHPYLKPDGRVFASSPNVAHYSVIRMLLAGRWDLSTYGAMDETHLRWFTPGTFREMFESCGYNVVNVRPSGSLGAKAGVASLLLHKHQYLLWRQIDLEAYCRSV